MRLSIWQQFSSNHSGRYTIVGVFPTSDQAKDASQQLQDLVSRIHEWRVKNKSRWQELSPAELEAERHYSTEWLEPIDWLWGDDHLAELHHREPAQRIILQDRFVMVDVPGASLTWQTGHQFAKVLSVLGSDVFQDIYEGYLPDKSGQIRFATTHFVLHIQPQDTVKQNSIYGALKKYVDHINDAQLRNYCAMPWAIFHHRAEEIDQKVNPDNYGQHEAQWLHEEKLRVEFIKKRNIRTGYPGSWTQEEHEGVRKLGIQDEEIAEYISMFRSDSRLYGATLSKQNESFILQSAYPIQALPSFIRWLEALNCDFTWQLSQASDDLWKPS